MTWLDWLVVASVAYVVVYELLNARNERRCLAARQRETEQRIAARKGEP